MRIAVYSDIEYGVRDGRRVAGESFAEFAAALGGEADRIVLVGRAGSEPERLRHVLPASADVVTLGAYPGLTDYAAVGRFAAGAVRRWWRLLDDVDGVWLLGPHPLAPLLAALAAVRRRRVVLGVRQDLPSYTRTRHPGRRARLALAWALELTWRALAVGRPTVTVGADLMRGYGRARPLVPVTIALRRAAGVPAEPPSRDFDAPTLTLLSIGRLDPEKNPLLLADVLARVRVRDPRWRLVVCGEGSLRDALAARLDELGVAEHAELRGHVSPEDGLDALYAEAQLLLHVSHTEGVPQVLAEAFAAGLPCVATAVGGVAGYADGAAELVPPADAGAAADAVALMAAEPERRRARVARGLEIARAHGLEHETARVAALFYDE